MSSEREIDNADDQDQEQPAGINQHGDIRRDGGVRADGAKEDKQRRNKSAPCCMVLLLSLLEAKGIG